MTSLRPEDLSLYTPRPALQQIGTDSFTIPINGSISAGGTTSFTGAAILARPPALTRLYVNQSPVPSDIFTPYTASDWLPVAPYGGTGALATINIGCTVSGNPSVASIASQGQLKILSPAITFKLAITNPYSGTMALTSTTLIVKYFSFAPTQAFS